MWRYAVGVLAGLMLAAGGILWWRPSAVAERAPVSRPAAGRTVAADEALPEPPAASEKTREEKRFSRYDKDRDGAVQREEYLASRRKAFAKLDADHDGRLTFDEWAAKTEAKFAGADADRDGRLTPAEFATTRVIRKSAPRCACPKPAAAERDEEG